jgi:hypothetical protein
LVEARRIDGKVRYEHVASLGSVPASPSVADRIALWRRVYETLAELANRIDAETQGKIISAVHSRIPIVTPNEQRALRVRQRPQRPDKASRHEGAKGGFTRVTCSTGHAGVSANSQLTLRVDHSMKPVSVAEGTAIGAACHSL